jgi:N-acetylneuraminic acid mutarotase
LRLQELESRLAPASFCVSSQLQISCLDNANDISNAPGAVVFFESGIADFEALRHGLNTATDAVLLDSGGDGLTEMAAFLSTCHNLTSIGLVAHGSPGEIYLGAATLNAQTFPDYTRELAAVRSALAIGGELDLWSCSVAAGGEGESLVQDLAIATGTGIAASVHPIGASALGGSWQLDVRLAGARAEVPFDAASLIGFREVLGAWDSVPSMLVATANQTATLLKSGKVLIAGGNDSNNNPIGSAEQYDPTTNSWSAATSLATARYGHTATLLADGKVLVTGGNGVNNRPLASAELYDPASNTWSSAAPMSTAREYHVAVLLASGEVLVMGGNDDKSNPLASAELYDPVSNTWSTAAAMGDPRRFETATVLGNGKVLVAGGYDAAGVVTSAELYDPVSGSWSAAGAMATARAKHTAVLLGNGDVLVAGGSGSAGILASAELYDPSKNTWSTASPMSTVRYGHTATVLGDGNVLVTGGFAYTGILRGAEVYHPTGNAWFATASMDTARIGQTATLLGNGQVLIAGGSNGVSLLASAERYDQSGLDLSQSTLAVTPTSISAGTTASVTLTAKDSDGNLLPQGGLSFSFGLGTGAGSGTFSNLTDNHNGTYSATFTGTTAGPVTITAKLSGQPLVTSLPVITVIPGPVSPSQSTVSLSSSTIALGSTLLVTLMARDGAGNPVLVGGSTFRFGLGAGTGSGTFSGLADSQNGLYTAAFTATAIGPVAITAFLEGQPVSSTQTVTVTPARAAQGTWGLVASLVAARAQHTATLLGNGKVLVSGGAATDGPLASAELYDPDTGTWSSAGSMATARSAFQATLLGDGQVLAAGGTGKNGSLASAELYDPEAKAWSSAGTMVTSRAAYAAVLLGNGKVLVTGGTNNGSPLTSAELYDPISNSWSAVASMASPRSGQTATLLGNGRVLIAGGYSSTGQYLASAELYDPINNIWSSAGPMSTARADQTATLLGDGKVLIAGGNGLSGVLSSAELYDPVSNTWTSAGFLEDDRAGQTATLLANGTVLIAGGMGASGALASAELYEPMSNTWSSAGLLSAPMQYQTATLLDNGNVLVTGGTAGGITLGTAEVYDLGLSNPPGVWNSAAPMHTARSSQTATLLSNDKVLVSGGYNNGYLSSAELYDPMTNTWSSAGAMTAARYQDNATLLDNGRVLVTGGYGTAGILANAELYDPFTNDWFSAGSMATGRYAQSATLLANGKVLIVGGYGAGNVLASTEIYDPDTNSWSSAASMTESRYGHTATLLGNGEVLVAGGSVGGSLLASAELYNPVSNTWSSAGVMATPRSSATATLLGDGQVLISGGLGPSGALSSAELYDPTTNSWTSAGAMSMPRSQGTATLLGSGDVLVAGGAGTGAFLSSAELYDPVKNIWSSAGILATGRYEHTATLLPNGKVLIAGGYGSSGGKGANLAGAELYDPAGVDPSQSTLTLLPATIPAGGTATVTLTAKDVAGNQEATGGLSFSFGLGTGAGSGTFSNPTDNNNGTYTATFMGTAIGPVAITATLNNQAITSTLPVVTVTPAAPMAITNVSGASLTAGGTLTFTVTAEDSTGHPLPGYTGTVQLSSTDSRAAYNGGSLPATYTFVAADHGVHTFAVTLQSAGSQTITATDQTDSHLTATTGTITVVPGNFSNFVVALAGGNALVAGNPFLFTVQAADAFGNPVGSYTGPASVTISATPPDPQGGFPFTGTLNGRGFGFFLGNLETAGSYTLAVSAGTIGATSANLTVTPAAANYFKVTAPAAAITGVLFNITVTALDMFGNIATAYSGLVHFTSSDASARLPSDAMLTEGSGVFSAALDAAGGQTITATDTVAATPRITGTTSAIGTRGLTVVSFMPNATGFTATFNKPFVPQDIVLYGAGKHTVQDVTLVGAKNGPINGSLLIDATSSSITFSGTASGLSLLNGFISPVLPDDTYTVTLVSGLAGNGFVDSLGAGLDGTDSGSHANYVTTFTTHYQTDHAPILSIGDFARGSDHAAVIDVPNDTGHGIPITLYNAAKVTDVAFTLSYNPALLTVTGASSGDASLPGSSFTLVGAPAITDANHATADFHFSAASPQSGTVVLGDIMALVPDSAAGTYKAKELLGLGAVVVNLGAVTGVVSADGVHVNAYAGDVTGNGTIDALDIATAATVARGDATGFAAYQTLDPAVVGDVALDYSVDAGDVSDLAAYVSRLPVGVVPPLPNDLTITPSGADPTLSLGAAQRQGDKEKGRQGKTSTPPGLLVSWSPGLVVTVPVMLDEPHPTGSTGMTEAILALTYDPSVLSVSSSDIALGSIPERGVGWQLTSTVDARSGQIGLELYSTTAIATNDAGSLASIRFHVLPNDRAPATAVQLVRSVWPDGRQFSTQVDDAQGRLVLSAAIDELSILTSEVAAPGLDQRREFNGLVRAPAFESRPGASDHPDLMATAPNALDVDLPEEEMVIAVNAGSTGGDSMSVPTAVAGSPSPQAGGASGDQLAVPSFQIGAARPLNMLLYQNSPRQLAVNRLLADWGNIIDGVAEFNPLIPFWPASLTPDFQAVSMPAQSATPLAHAATREQAALDRFSLVDKLFADRASETDDLSDFADF